MNLLPSELAVFINAVQIGAERLRDLSDLRQNFFTMRENDEDILVNLFIVRGVNDGFRNLRLVHVEIASQGTPEDALKSTNPVSWNDTRDKANVHDGERLLALSITILASGNLVLNIPEQGGFVVVERLSDLIRMTVGLYWT